MLRVEINYATGIPQTAVSGFVARGRSMHWTAGLPGRAGALSTIRHFQATRYTVNASYHLLVWHLCSDHVTGAMWIVPPGRASHSMNPANAYVLHPDKPRALQLSRFTEVRRILGPKASDPNAGCISISFCGMPADLDKALDCPTFVVDMKRLVAEIDAIPATVDRPLFGHGWIQPISRYDPGEELIPAIYAQEDPMSFAKARPVQPYYATIGGNPTEGTNVRTSPVIDPTPEYTIPAGKTAELLVVGEIEGDEFPAGSGNRTWKIYVTSNATAFWVFHSSQEVSRRPYGGGVTDDQLKQAKRLEYFRGRDEGVAVFVSAGTQAAKELQP